MRNSISVLDSFLGFQDLGFGFELGALRFRVCGLGFGSGFKAHFLRLRLAPLHPEACIL